MASINKDWSNCLIWVTINPCLSSICLYSDAVRSFPPVATNMVSDSRRARFGPRLSSSKIFSQIRSPPPNKQTLKTKGVVTTNFDILGFFLPILTLNATYVLFNKGKYMVKRRVIKTFSEYYEDTTIASLVLSLLKEKLSSIYVCRHLDEGSDQAVVGFRVLWYKGLECVYEVSQACLLYWAVPAHALSRNWDLGKGASPPSHINTTTILWRNKAWAEPGWYSGSARLIGLAHLIKTNKWMTLYFNRVHNSPLRPYETTKKLNSLNTKVMNNVNIKFKKGKDVLSILKRSGEIYSNLHMIKKLKYVN